LCSFNHEYPPITWTWKPHVGTLFMAVTLTQFIEHDEVLECVWNLMAQGDAREGKWRGNWRMEWVASTLTLPRNVVYPALLPLMRTTWLPAVDWTDAPADLNGLVRFGERRNLVSARVPSRFKRTLLHRPGKGPIHTPHRWVQVVEMWVGRGSLPGGKSTRKRTDLHLVELYLNSYIPSGHAEVQFLSATWREFTQQETPRVTIYIYIYCVQSVPGGMDKTSGECSLC